MSFKAGDINSLLAILRRQNDIADLSLLEKEQKLCVDLNQFRSNLGMHPAARYLDKLAQTSAMPTKDDLFSVEMEQLELETTYLELQNHARNCFKLPFETNDSELLVSLSAARSTMIDECAKSADRVSFLLSNGRQCISLVATLIDLLQGLPPAEDLTDDQLRSKLGDSASFFQRSKDLTSQEDTIAALPNGSDVLAYLAVKVPGLIAERFLSYQLGLDAISLAKSHRRNSIVEQRNLEELQLVADNLESLSSAIRDVETTDRRIPIPSTILRAEAEIKTWRLDALKYLESVEKSLQGIEIDLVQEKIRLHSLHSSHDDQNSRNKQLQSMAKELEEQIERNIIGLKTLKHEAERYFDTITVSSRKFGTIWTQINEAKSLQELELLDADIGQIIVSQSAPTCFELEDLYSAVITIETRLLDSIEAHYEEAKMRMRRKSISENAARDLELIGKGLSHIQSSLDEVLIGLEKLCKSKQDSEMIQVSELQIRLHSISDQLEAFQTMHSSTISGAGVTLLHQIEQAKSLLATGFALVDKVARLQAVFEIQARISAFRTRLTALITESWRDDEVESNGIPYHVKMQADQLKLGIGHASDFVAKLSEQEDNEPSEALVKCQSEVSTMLAEVEIFRESLNSYSEAYVASLREKSSLNQLRHAAESLCSRLIRGVTSLDMNDSWADDVAEINSQWEGKVVSEPLYVGIPVLDHKLQDLFAEAQRQRGVTGSSVDKCRNLALFVTAWNHVVRAFMTSDKTLTRLMNLLRESDFEMSDVLQKEMESIACPDLVDVFSRLQTLDSCFSDTAQFCEAWVQTRYAEVCRRKEELAATLQESRSANLKQGLSRKGQFEKILTNLQMLSLPSIANLYERNCSAELKVLELTVNDCLQGAILAWNAISDSGETTRDADLQLIRDKVLDNVASRKAELDKLTAANRIVGRLRDMEEEIKVMVLDDAVVDLADRIEELLHVRRNLLSVDKYDVGPEQASLYRGKIIKHLDDLVTTLKTSLEENASKQKHAAAVANLTKISQFSEKVISSQLALDDKWREASVADVKDMEALLKTLSLNTGEIRDRGGLYRGLLTEISRMNLDQKDEQQLKLVSDLLTKSLECIERHSKRFKFLETCFRHVKLAQDTVVWLEALKASVLIADLDVNDETENLIDQFSTQLASVTPTVRLMKSFRTTIDAQCDARSLSDFTWSKLETSIILHSEIHALLDKLSRSMVYARVNLRFKDELEELERDFASLAVRIRALDTKPDEKEFSLCQESLGHVEQRLSNMVSIKDSMDNVPAQVSERLSALEAGVQHARHLWLAIRNKEADLRSNSTQQKVLQEVSRLLLALSDGLKSIDRQARSLEEVTTFNESYSSFQVRFNAHRTTIQRLLNMLLELESPDAERLQKDWQVVCAETKTLPKPCRLPLPNGKRPRHKHRETRDYPKRAGTTSKIPKPFQEVN